MNAKRVNTKKMKAWTGIAMVLAVFSALCLAAAAEDNTPVAWIKRGIELSSNESYEEATQAFDRALEQDPQNLNAWLFKSMALTSLGTKIALENKNLGIKDREASGMTAFDKAIEAHERAVEIAPENATVWTYKANNLAKIGSFTDNLSILNESLQAFDKALELNPEDADAWHGKGIALVYISQTRGDTSRYEEALRYVDRALEIDPQTAGALENKAGILSELGRQNESDKFYSEALELYNTSIETEKSTEDLVEAWLSKGFILQAQGKYEDAVKALGNATDADPMNGLAWKVKGVLLWRELKEYDDAVNAFDKALQINPKDPLTWMNKGDALKALGRQAEADEAYAKARELGYQG